MNTQAPPGNLSRRLTNHDERIDGPAWEHAKAAGDIVGTCRECGGHLVVDQVPDQKGLRFEQARCLQCGHEYAAPAGRIMCRSTRHSEMPAGWWQHRKGRP